MSNQDVSEIKFDINEKPIIHEMWNNIIQPVRYTHPQKPGTSIKLLYVGHVKPASLNICEFRKYICYVCCPPERGIV